LQNTLTPVFVDSSLPTYNPTPHAIEAAIGPRTRAIMLAHALGNPFEAAVLRALADRHGLWLIEDCCDAFGSLLHGKNIGSFGHLGTLSFYPAHHITTGEGGAVFTDDPLLARCVESFRDWGRDCYCAPGRDNPRLRCTGIGPARERGQHCLPSGCAGHGRRRLPRRARHLCHQSHRYAEPP